MERHRRDKHYQRQVYLQDLIKQCSKHLDDATTQDYAVVAATLREELLPVLQQHVNREFWEYESRLGDHPGWHWVTFSQFLEEIDAVVDRLAAGKSGGGESDVDDETLVHHALESAVAIAEEENVVMENYRDRVDAVGFSVKLGHQLKRGDMNFGDPVKAITRARGSLKHFFAGDTGTGKTVAASRQFEDYYRSQFEGGRRYKCLDYVGLGKAENIMFDLPQMQDDLRRAREDDHDLPAGFDEIDGFEPEMEVFVPLSERLNDEPIPYNEESCQFVARPFTIPASDLSEGLVASLIESQLTNTREQTVRDAYQVVDENNDDWSLADLADEIRHRDELSDKHIKDSLRVLRSLQNGGFVRTKADGRALNWDAIMESTETVTAFSQSLLTDPFQELMVVAYLIDKHWNLRIDRNEYPPACVWVRELWEISQHQRQRSNRPDREKAVLEFIIDKLLKMMRKPRDISTHFVMDTQEPTDVERAVRERFNRYLIFDSNASLVEEIMDWQGEQKGAHWDFLDTISGEPGQGGIIGGCEPALNPNRWGVSPVQFAPPSWHHHDKQSEGEGWTARVDYAEDEVLRTPDWDTSMADDLEVSIELPAEEEAEEAKKAEAERFREEIREEARHLAQKGIPYTEIAERIPNNPNTGEKFTKQSISQWVNQN